MHRLAICLGLAMLPAFAPATERPADFATGLPLQVPPGQPLLRVELPLAVHAQARPDLADVRIFNADGEAVPLALAPARAGAAAVATAAVPHFPLRDGAQPGSGLDVRIEADGRLIAVHREGATAPAATTWILDLSAMKEPAVAVLPDWAPPTDSFSSAVRVEGSDDLRQWALVADATLVDLHFGDHQLRQRRIALPASRFRYLRLTASPALPALTRAEVETAGSGAQAPERWLEVTGQAATTPGDYDFDLGAHLTARHLDLRLPQPNTLAPVEWQVREHRRDDWRAVAATTAWRLQHDGSELQAPAVDVGAVPGRYWRLHVDPRSGGLGAGLPVLRLGWTPTQLVFVARGRPPFLLAFGQRDARPAALPLPTLVPGYRPGREATLPAAATGPGIALGGHDAPAPGREDVAPADWRRWLLWGVLLAGVGLLALMARSLLRGQRGA